MLSCSYWVSVEFLCAETIRERQRTPNQLSLDLLGQRDQGTNTMTATVLLVLGWATVFLILVGTLRYFGRRDERRREVSD